MSYNLMAEGDLDLFELAQLSERFLPLELFPIPAEISGPAASGGVAKLPPDALGVAIPSSHVGPEAFAALRDLVPFLWQRGAEIHDLFTGTRVETPTDLEELLGRLAD
jgi:hypothetical protein